ncbi:unnamed protein product [Oikopleura dioica]|uniref:Reverse transcriptase domain-containing protein n=1 Tax=Oikopleura dioica TaxID=34765 RepID=E4XLA2_OIKDI|nr:unnamed protein product [Oikopleura dioica]
MKNPTKKEMPRIINPTNADMHELMNQCNLLNEKMKEDNSQISFISVNPGKMDASTLRDLVDYLPGNDIIMINELHANHDLFSDAVLAPLNYKAYFNDTCPDGLIYSAICVSKEIDHLVTALPHIGTATSVKLKLGKYGSINLTNVYRNIPRNDETDFYEKNYNATEMIFCDWLDKCEEVAKKDNSQTIVAGDWNCDTLNPRAEDSSLLVDRINHTMRNHTNGIRYPTFHRNNCRSSSIDYFMLQNARGVKVKALNLHNSPLAYDGHSGHQFTMQSKGLERPFELILSSKYDEIGIRRDSVRMSYELNKLDIKDPSEYIEKSFEMASKIIEKNHQKIARIGKKSCKAKGKQPLDTRKYYEALNYANSIIYNESDQDETKFDAQEIYVIKSFARKLCIMLRKLQRRDNEKIAEKIAGECNKPLQAAWKITNELLAAPPVRILEENVEELMDEVVELQRKTTICPEKYTKHVFKPRNNVKMKEFEVHVHSKSSSENSILGEYNKLKDYTRGSTGISKRILDLFHVACFYDFIAKPILLAIQSGRYPRCWRTNRTVILPKKKGIRPISISEIFAKILEKVIINQITDFVEYNGFLPAAQNGFRSVLSTGTSLAAVNLFACEAIDKGDTIALIAIDMRNAFGTPHHRNIVKCLGNIFEGKALRILGESLERWAIVEKDGTLSRKEKMEEFGVPQGSVCSPTLFCLFISEIVNIIDERDDNVKINIFADDTIISCKGKDFDEMKNRAEKTLDILGEKLLELGLQLVPEKTGIMIFDKTDQKERSIRIVDTPIMESETLKYLGSTIGKSKGIMNYELNNELKIRKMKIMVNRIRSIKSYIGKDATKTLHRAFNIGVLNHNLDILPKWKAKNHNKGQNLYMRALDIDRETRWFLQDDEYESKKRQDRIDALTKSGHPTFFECQMKLFHSQLWKTIRYGKNTTMKKEIDKALTMFSVDTGERVGTIPDIFAENRIKDSFAYFKKVHKIRDSGSINKSSCVYYELIKALIKLESIELKIVPEKGMGKVKRELCWPYNLHKDFNMLPINIRNAIIEENNKSITKSFFKGRHKHPENKLDCIDCIDKKFFCVSEYIEDPCETIFNTTIENELINELILEENINTAHARFEAMEEALEEVERKRPDMNLSGLKSEWLKKGSKKWPLRRCLAEIKLLAAKIFD